jgi:uncharacterized protein (DUF433 family)/predicted nucleotidyltransferase
VEAVQLLKVILYGSAALGEQGSGSECDILVVMPEGAHRRETSKLLYKKLVGYGVPVDIIVATPGDLAKHEDNIGLIYRTALKEGKELYAARYEKEWPMPVKWKDHIVSTPDVVRGKPRIKNTRIPVSLILGYLAAGSPVDKIRNEFPDLNKIHIAACLDYARDLADFEVSLRG